MGGIVVIGGGGHARVVIEILLATKAEVVGFCDPSFSEGECFGHVACLGDDGVLERLRADGVEQAIVALGDNGLRCEVALRVRSLGFRLVNAVHPSAQISPSAILGQGIAIMANVVINAATTVGDNVIVNTGATVDHDCKIGGGAHIAPGAHLAGRITVGEQCLIGVGSAVGCGRPLSIGDGAVVGSGSVIIEDVPAYSTVAGNPANQLKPPARRRTAL